MNIRKIHDIIVRIFFGPSELASDDSFTYFKEKKKDKETFYCVSNLIVFFSLEIRHFSLFHAFNCVSTEV